MTNVQEFWNQQHSSVYTKTDWINLPSLFAKWAIQYFPKTGTILELGAGQGQDSRFFASKGYTVISTDFSTEALKLSKEKLPEELQTKVTIAQLDISKPFSYTSNMFDVVYSHLAVHYFTSEITEQIFSEIHRILKPSGVVAILANSTSDPEYNTGKKIEDDYFETAGLEKRYFSADSIRQFGHLFTPLIVDNQGTTYKDNAKGITNLIRFIGRK